jgi:addiction module HigA family antidote
MVKPVQSPGSVLKLFLRAYHLNPTSLARAIKMSQASIRLITLDKIRISAGAALRLGKIFDISPEYWLKLQNAWSLEQAAKDTKLAAVIKTIPAAQTPDTGKSAPKKTVKKAPVPKTALKAPRGSGVKK